MGANRSCGFALAGDSNDKVKVKSSATDLTKHQWFALDAYITGFQKACYSITFKVNMLAVHNEIDFTNIKDLNFSNLWL